MLCLKKRQNWSKTSVYSIRYHPPVFFVAELLEVISFNFQLRASRLSPCGVPDLIPVESQMRRRMSGGS